ncbi:response regulator [Paenibacillus sp. PK3_47]|uniref:response regulator transcription factor n=1 Tax=Paenibacillus sp. PK3_47 TaxID=2072642 RepID=UPI00201D3C01|nr:response regulator [Paenibacillus sp. PK3_47]
MRLLIVDDGHYIVEYLKHLLDWKKFGIGEILTTTNSIEAKRMLEQEPVDILITDIRMPEVSGIDLLQHINEKMLPTKVVFLSGYSQFDYAQKAIRLGALDYLLKPVDKDDMEKAMQQVVQSIDAKPSKTPAAWDKFDGLGYLLSVITEQNHPGSDFSAYEAALMNQSFCFFQIPAAGDKDEMILRDCSGHLDSFIWPSGTAITGVILSTNAEILVERIGSIAFSECFEFHQKNAVRHYFYQLFFQENVNSADFSMFKDCGAVSRSEPFEWEQIRRNLARKFSRLGTRKQKIIYLMECIHLLYSAADRLKQADAAGWIFGAAKEPDTVLQTLLTSCNRMERSTESPGSSIIQNIQTYIAEHIGDGLSLEDLGKLVHLHPVYLSKFYKQETGENLSNYIAMKRLEKASRLLTESSLHVVDISQLVGYKKPQYFIKLFKDQYGITPYQYRRQRIK